MEKKKLAIGSDHAGYFLKEKLLKYLAKEQYEVRDFGTYTDESVDYPDYAHPLAKAVSSGEFELGHFNLRERQWY